MSRLKRELLSATEERDSAQLDRDLMAGRLKHLESELEGERSSHSDRGREIRILEVGHTQTLTRRNKNRSFLEFSPVTLPEIFEAYFTLRLKTPIAFTQRYKNSFIPFSIQVLNAHNRKDSFVQFTLDPLLPCIHFLLLCLPHLFIEIFILVLLTHVCIVFCLL